jgi:8-amino-7-oxononanoate synthase
MSIRDAWLQHLHQQLQIRQRDHLARELHPLASPAGPEILLHGRSYIQFCSNNYLGLTTDPEVIAAAREATDRWGTGSGASRLVAGSLAIHHELETALAHFKNAQSALLFPTGYMANLAVLTTLAGPRDVIVSDKLNHASLLDAARYSAARHRTFPHGQAARAAELLQRPMPEAHADATATPRDHAGSRRFLVTDSVFSMDGDVADLPALCAAADTADALLIIDEAHATGILGPRGAGLAELQNVEDRIALSISTLSKALGSLGGFVTGPCTAIDYLINHARSFIYTTALPPACAAAALASLKIIEREPARRHRVADLANHVRHELAALGFNCGHSATPIIPVILGDPETALRAAAFLRDKGLYIPAIRPPTVPPHTARLRLSLMATHTDTHIDHLLTTFRALKSVLFS